MNGTNGNSKKRDETASRIIEAAKKSHGLLTLVAKRTGLGYRTVCRYASEFPSVAQAVRDAKEAMLDFAEAKLFEAIHGGDKTMIIFYLKTQGKGRGYIERVEQTGIGGEPIKYDITVKDGESKRLTEQLFKGGAMVPHISLS